MQHTYQMDYSVPPNLKGGAYRLMVQNEWDSLLNDPDVTEKRVQQFLEKNPCLLPFKEIPLTHGNGHALSSAVVTQPPLAGLKTKIPDFLYFTGNSGDITAVFIEIESPTKRWFTAGGQPTAEFSQAENQIATWKTWFSDPANVLAFERDYRVRNYPPLNDRVFRQTYLLVLGRRSMISDGGLNKLRNSRQRQDETWMTYDRLRFSPHFDDAVTVRLDCSGLSPTFRVTEVQPIIRLGPHQYPDYHELLGLEDAINSNGLISAERKQFLSTRLAYWRNWYASRNGPYAVAGTDFAGE